MTPTVIYKPKQVGRRANRYKRYFGAKPAPMSSDAFIDIVYRGKWSANKN